MLLAYAAIDGLVAGMGVDINEAGHHHEALTVDDCRCGGAESGANMHDRVAVEGNIDILPIDVALATWVPGDHPFGVSDQCRGHGEVSSN
jgi:hypothetical protein